MMSGKVLVNWPGQMLVRPQGTGVSLKISLVYRHGSLNQSVVPRSIGRGRRSVFKSMNGRQRQLMGKFLERRYWIGQLMQQKWTHGIQKQRINYRLPERAIGPDCLETTTFAFLKKVQKPLVIKMCIQAVWQLLHVMIAIGLCVSKQASVFRVVSGALNGLRDTMILNKERPRVTWKLDQDHMSHEFCMMIVARLREWSTLTKKVTFISKRPVLFA